MPPFFKVHLWFYELAVWDRGGEISVYDDGYVCIGESSQCIGRWGFNGAIVDVSTY